MLEDFDALNNQKKQEEEEDEDETSESYSYPSYSRFTYTGKTKSRLGRSRFMRQTGNKDENNKLQDNSSATSDIKPNNHFQQSNLQPPKTPGVGWLQRDSSLPSHPYTPGGNSAKVLGSCSDLSSFPSQSNFLFNLKNDSAQNSSCKRNLAFSTTPFKTKEKEVSENHSNNHPLRDLNQVRKPENPFSKLDFFTRLKEENKENSEKIMSDGKNGDLDPSWNQLKKICDAAISYPNLSAQQPETNRSEQNDMRKIREIPKSNLFVPFVVAEKKDDDSNNMPLDLSSAESTASRTLFSRSLMSGGDHIDGDSSGSLNRPLKDLTNESLVKRTDDSTTQKTNTDALSGFLPKFLVPKNKKESPDKDVSTPSIGTVVEKMIDFQPQTPCQKPPLSLQAPTMAPVVSSENGNELYSTSQHKPASVNDLKKVTSHLPPISLTHKDPNPSLLSVNNEVQPQLQLYHKMNQKYSPPSMVPNNIVSQEPRKLSPPNSILGNAPNVPTNNVPDFRNLVNNGHNILKQEQNNYVHHLGNSNLEQAKTEKEISSLAQNLGAKLGFVPKTFANVQTNHFAPDKQINQFRSVNVSSNDAVPANQFKSDVKPIDSMNPVVVNQAPSSSCNRMEGSEPMNIPYAGVVQGPKLMAQTGSVEKNVNQFAGQQIKPVGADQRGPDVFPRLQEVVQPSVVKQKTYLAPQQPSDRNNAGDFPHVKPEIPQLGGAKPSFSAMKKPIQFKMSAARGMPSRADTELSVNGKSYAILSMLGKGGSSEVYQVLDSCTSKLLAVKCVDLSMVDKTIADGYLNEIDLLSRLQGCASVIRMFDYEYVQDCKMLYVVMEKGDTDLSHLIRDISKTKKISMSMIIYYWTEMLQAVKDIHDQGIIHSDLKPANFLLVSGRLKLIDFGIASSQGDMTSVVKEVTTGTWNYMSPEAIKNNNASGKGFKITYKSDVWSLGCILYNLVYGKTPFSHITNTWGKLTAIADPNHCIQFPDVGAPAVLVKALRSCFHREPKLRPTVAELLSLPYHSTGDGSELSGVGRQVQEILPPLEWLKVAHLFPGVKSNQEGKTVNNSG